DDRRDHRLPDHVVLHRVLLRTHLISERGFERPGVIGAFSPAGGGGAPWLGVPFGPFAPDAFRLRNISHRVVSGRAVRNPAGGARPFPGGGCVSGRAAPS